MTVPRERSFEQMRKYLGELPLTTENVDADLFEEMAVLEAHLLSQEKSFPPEFSLIEFVTLRTKLALRFGRNELAMSLLATYDHLFTREASPAQGDAADFMTLARDVAAYAGRYTETLKYGNRVVALWDARFAQPHPGRAFHRTQLARYLVVGGRWNDAKRPLLEAIKIRLGVWSQAHVLKAVDESTIFDQYLSSANDFVFLSSGNGKCDEAVEVGTEAVRIAIASKGSEFASAALALVINSLAGAIACQDAGDFAAGVRFAAQAEDLFAKFWAADMRRKAEVLITRATTYFAAEDWANGKHSLELAVQILEKLNIRNRDYFAERESFVIRGRLLKLGKLVSGQPIDWKSEKKRGADDTARGYKAYGTQ
jgi:hypothetical protein